MNDFDNIAKEAAQRIEANAKFKEYMNQLSKNINEMLNPDGVKNVGFSLFIYDANKANPTVSHLTNVDSEATYTVVAPWAVRHKHMKQKKERRIISNE